MVVWMPQSVRSPLTKTLRKSKAGQDQNPRSGSESTMALRTPISADPATGTNPFDQHRPECEPDKFIIREPYGIETIQRCGQREAELEKLGQKILAVIDGSASGHVSFSEIVRTDPKPDWRAAVLRLVKLGVLNMHRPTGNALNDYFWRHQTRAQKRKARR